jgi:hypothetical protein
MTERIRFQTKSGKPCSFGIDVVDEMYFSSVDCFGAKAVPLLEVVGDMMCYRLSDDATEREIKSALLKEWKAGRCLPEGYIVYEVDRQWFMKYEVLATEADFDSSDDDGSFCYTEMPDDYYPED